MIGRHVHDDTWLMRRAGAQSGFARNNRAEKLVRVQASFHQQLGLALAHELHGFRRRRVTVRNVDNPGGPE